MEITEEQKRQIVHRFNTYVELANKFFEEDNALYHQYWVGQVMGMAKIISLLDITDINTDYYLKNLL